MRSRARATYTRPHFYFMTTLTQLLLSLRMSATFKAANGSSGVNNGRYPVDPTTTIAIGNAVAQSNVAAAVVLAVNTASPTLIDLTNIQDVGGAVVTTMAKLTHYMLVNQSLTAGEDLTLGGGVNALWTPSDPKVCYANGGVKLDFNPYNGWTIDATHKIIQVAAAAGAAVPGMLYLWGRA